MPHVIHEIRLASGGAGCVRVSDQNIVHFIDDDVTCLYLIGFDKVDEFRPTRQVVKYFFNLFFHDSSIFNEYAQVVKKTLINIINHGKFVKSTRVKIYAIMFGL